MAYPYLDPYSHMRVVHSYTLPGLCAFELCLLATCSSQANVRVTEFCTGMISCQSTV